MLFVALSSLQGRPMARAFDELAAHAVAIQLTPGNLPTPGFAQHVGRAGVPTRAHHGFAWDARRQPVWHAGGACVVAAESVHPPQDGEAGGATWWTWYERAERRPIVEIMYPGYALGTGEEVERAMAARFELAVDVSHAFIQREQGVMTEATWRRLCDYDRVAEVHVSANAGRHDTHQPIRDDTFGLAWARARLAAGAPVVLECYMHRLGDAERRAQIELVGRSG